MEYGALAAVFDWSSEQRPAVGFQNLNVGVRHIVDPNTFRRRGYR
jgi:hypothetical protein